MIIELENLKLIPQLLEELKQVKEDLSNLTKTKQIIDLTRLKNVCNYLNVSKPTIYNMIADGRLKQNIHYKKQINKNSVKITFVESAIVKYKKEFL